MSMKVLRPVAYVCFALPWLLALAVFGWVCLRRFPPSGTVVLQSSFREGEGGFIHTFLPSERVSKPGVQPDGWTGQRIIGDPVYFTARVPGPYDSVRLDIDFRAQYQPLIEFGRAPDPASPDVDLQPMYSAELAKPEWSRVAGGYVRAGTAATRLASADPRGVAVWGATTAMPLYADTQAASTTLAVSLRGAHDIYVAPAAGRVDMTFGLQDVNRKAGRKPIVVRVLRGDDLIAQDVLSSSGSRDTRMGTVVTHRVVVPNATPGVYHIAISADDNVFIRSIATTNRHWVIGPRLVFGDVVGFSTSTPPARAWTTSRHLVAETFHREGLQTIQLGDATTTLARTHEPFRIDLTEPTMAVRAFTAPQSDVRLVGDGFFALLPDAFFLPRPSRMTDGTSLALEGFTGVLTPYERPQSLGDGWMRASFTWPLDQNQDSLRFVLSAPGILSRLGAVDVRSVRLTFTRPPLTPQEWRAVMWQELRNAWHRL